MKARSDALALADGTGETVKAMFPAWEVGGGEIRYINDQSAN
jgi:hypothetical protein